MVTNPHQNSTSFEKRGERETQAWSIAAESFLLIQELISIGAPKQLLGARVAHYVSRAINGKAAVYWHQQRELVCEEPSGLAGPLRVSAVDLPLKDAPTPFTHTTTIEGAGGPIGIIACQAETEPSQILHFFSSILSGALSQQREIPKFVRDFLQAKNPTDSLEVYFRALLQHMNRDRGAIFIQEPDGVLHPICSVGVSSSYLNSVMALYAKSAGGIARATLETIQVEDTFADTRVEPNRAFMKQENIRSMAIVPIVYQSEPILGVTLYSDEPSALSARDLARLKALGLLMAPVLLAARERAALRALPISLFYQTERATTPLNNAATERHPQEVGTVSPSGISPTFSLTTKVPYLHGHLVSSQLLPKEAKPSSLLLGASRALRDPLTVVWGYLGMIESRMKRSNMQDPPRLERLQGSLQRLAQLSDELFDLAQYQSNTQPIDLCAVLASAARELNTEPAHTTAPLFVLADPNRLLKVLLALIKVNARFYPTIQEALPTLQEKPGAIQLRFGFQSPTHEQNFRLEESLGLTGAWISLLAKEWGGSFLIPSYSPVDALYLSLLRA